MIWRLKRSFGNVGWVSTDIEMAALRGGPWLTSSVAEEVGGSSSISSRILPGMVTIQLSCQVILLLFFSFLLSSEAVDEWVSARYLYRQIQRPWQVYVANMQVTPQRPLAEEIPPPPAGCSVSFTPSSPPFYLFIYLMTRWPCRVFSDIVIFTSEQRRKRESVLFPHPISLHTSPNGTFKALRKRNSGNGEARTGSKAEVSSFNSSYREHHLSVNNQGRCPHRDRICSLVRFSNCISTSLW